MRGRKRELPTRQWTWAGTLKKQVPKEEWERWAEHHLTQPHSFIQIIEHQSCASPCSMHWGHSND